MGGGGGDFTFPPQLDNSSMEGEAVQLDLDSLASRGTISYCSTTTRQFSKCGRGVFHLFKLNIDTPRRTGVGGFMFN